MSLLKDFTDLGNFYADKGGNRPYLEKRSNAYLDDFTRNAGSNNYTKFARDVNRWGQPGCQGQPWCAVYQFWKLVKIFGLKKALQIMGGGFYNCRSVTRHAKNNGTWKKTPKKGALVVFRNGTHIGSIINYNMDGVPSSIILTSSNNSTEREHLSLRASLDNCATWKSNVYQITDSKSGYSDLVVFEDGSVGILYENGTSVYREQISFRKIPAATIAKYLNE